MAPTLTALKPLKTARLDGASFFYVDFLSFAAFFSAFFASFCVFLSGGSFFKRAFSGAAFLFFLLVSVVFASTAAPFLRVASSTQGRGTQNLRRTTPVFTVDAIFCAAPVATRKANLGALRETRRPVSVFISDFSVTFSGVFSRVKFLDEFVLKSCD